MGRKRSPGLAGSTGTAHVNRQESVLHKVRNVEMVILPPLSGVGGGHWAARWGRKGAGREPREAASPRCALPGYLSSLDALSLSGVLLSSSAQCGQVTIPAHSPFRGQNEILKGKAHCIVSRQERRPEGRRRQCGCPPVPQLNGGYFLFFPDTCGRRDLLLRRLS